MTRIGMKTTIEQYSRCIDGKLHGFRLQWIAVEPRWASGDGRYLLAIEVLAEANECAYTVHVLVRAGATCEQLIKLLDDAVDEQRRNMASPTVAPAARPDYVPSHAPAPVGR